MSIPVHVYTSGDEAELFVNGVSQGRRQKKWYGYTNAPRLRWEGVKFVPGEITVKTWKDGRPWAEDRRVTAGDFDHFEFEDRKWGEKFLFRTVCAVDKKGVLVPDAVEDVDLPVPDGYKVLGTCNGDPTDLNSLRSKKVKTFSGKALIVYEFCK